MMLVPNNKYAEHVKAMNTIKNVPINAAIYLHPYLMVSTILEIRRLKRRIRKNLTLAMNKTM